MMVHPTAGSSTSTDEKTEQGLKLFEDITYLEEYYLTNAEIEVLEKCAHKIVEYIPDGARVIELGSG